MRGFEGGVEGSCELGWVRQILHAAEGREVRKDLGELAGEGFCKGLRRCRGECCSGLRGLEAGVRNQGLWRFWKGGDHFPEWRGKIAEVGDGRVESGVDRGNEWFVGAANGSFLEGVGNGEGSDGEADEIVRGFDKIGAQAGELAQADVWNNVGKGAGCGEVEGFSRSGGAQEPSGGNQQLDERELHRERLAWQEAVAGDDCVGRGGFAHFFVLSPEGAEGIP